MCAYVYVYVCTYIHYFGLHAREYNLCILTYTYVYKYIGGKFIGSFFFCFVLPYYLAFPVNLICCLHALILSIQKVKQDIYITLRRCLRISYVTKREGDK